MIRVRLMEFWTSWHGTQESFFPRGTVTSLHDHGELAPSPQDFPMSEYQRQLSYRTKKTHAFSIINLLSFPLAYVLQESTSPIEARGPKTPRNY